METSPRQSDDLVESAIRRLDKLATEEKENKAIMSARPKLAFESFNRDVSCHSEQLFEMFYDPNALDKGASQQLFQLSKLLAPDLAPTVISFSGVENSAQKAKDWLSLKFNSLKKMIPVIYQKVKDLSPTRSEAKVP